MVSAEILVARAIRLMLAVQDMRSENLAMTIVCGDEYEAPA